MSVAVIRKVIPALSFPIWMSIFARSPNRSPICRLPTMPRYWANPAAHLPHPGCRQWSRYCCARTIACSSTTACTASSGSCDLTSTTDFPVRSYRDGELLTGKNMPFIVNGPTCDSEDAFARQGRTASRHPPGRLPGIRHDRRLLLKRPHRLQRLLQRPHRHHHVRSRIPTVG